VNQKDIIERVAKETGWSLADSKTAVQTVNSVIATALAKGTSVRSSLGTFSLSKRGARTGRNPRTGAPVKIKASKSVRFKVAKPIKDKLNKR
jgi:DNA-binding protein HU-beta